MRIIYYIVAAESITTFIMEHLQTLSESRLSAPMGEAPAFSRSAPSRTIVHAKLEMTTPGDFDESEADSAEFKTLCLLRFFAKPCIIG